MQINIVTEAMLQDEKMLMSFVHAFVPGMDQAIQFVILFLAAWCPN